MGLSDRLRHARNSLGLTLAVVEERTKIGTSTLSDFENEKREPKLTQLKKLADTYGRPISFFLEENPVEPEVVLWRKKPDSPMAEEIQVRLRTLAEQYHNLEIWCGEHEPGELPFASGPIESKYRYQDAAKLAHNLRKNLALGDRPGQSLLRILEEVCKIKVFHLDFEPTGSAACTWADTFGAAVLLNASHVRWRRNFDLAHELFHLLTWKIFRQEESRDGIVASEKEEKLATCFARNLLMPEEPFRETVDSFGGERGGLDFNQLFEIARQFDVSVEAALRQRGFVYNMPSRETQEHVEQARKLASFWETRESSRPPERPPRFRALATHALRKGAISAGRFAEYLGTSRREAMQVVEQEAEDNAEVEVANP
jgi:Zn-dependent peptidase ImmA (M78 family)/DNA-binding XRE family transcriptional regulator